MANTNRIPWPTPIAFHGQHQSHPMTNTNRIPWPTLIASHGQHQSHSMANTNRIPWPTQIASHGQHQSHSMANTSRISWTTLTTPHIPKLTTNLFPRRDPQDPTAAVRPQTRYWCPYIPYEVEVLKKTSIHGTRRYASTLQCSNTGHVLFVATQDVPFAACRAVPCSAS